MIRKLVLSSAAIVALTFGLLAPAASAQTPTPGPTAVPCTATYPNCIAYPDSGLGGAAQPTSTPTPKPIPTADPAADNVAATTGTGNAIAFTGSESRVLGYVGASLIGFGAIAVGAARRKNSSDE